MQQLADVCECVICVCCDVVKITHFVATFPLFVRENCANASLGNSCVLVQLSFEAEFMRQKSKRNEGVCQRESEWRNKVWKWWGKVMKQSQSIWAVRGPCAVCMLYLCYARITREARNANSSAFDFISILRFVLPLHSFILRSVSRLHPDFIWFWLCLSR